VNVGSVNEAVAPNQRYPAAKKPVFPASGANGYRAFREMSKKSDAYLLGKKAVA
jgi:hypothetical protein